MTKMNKITTGVPGLDDMLEGGLIEGRPYLIIGGPGAGKTILSMQFLMEGASKNEKGLFISLEEPTEELVEDMNSFGWNLHHIKIIDTTQDPKSGRWVIRAESIVSKPELNLPNLITLLKEKISAYKPKRMVIDSVTSIKLLYESQAESRKAILSLMNFLYNSGCTTLVTSESTEIGNILMEEFLCSGVIELKKIEVSGEKLYGVSIEKMRGSSFDQHTRPMKITSNGLTVFPNETIFQ